MIWRLLARLCCPDRALRRPTVDDLLIGEPEPLFAGRMMPCEVGDWFWIDEHGRTRRGDE